jgi:hypothetical protein
VTLFGAMLAVNAAVLWIAGWPVPFGDMARATTLAAAIVLAAMAMLGGPLTLWHEVVGGTAFTFAIVAVVFAGWDRLVAVVTSDVRAGAAIAVAGAILGALTLSAAIARRKDF